MGDYSVPAEIRRLKPKGTMVKKVKNGFYVYEHSSKKESVINPDGTVTRKTVNQMGKCIGSITLNEGFIPNINRLHDDSIIAKNYGDYAFAVECGKPTLSALEDVFNKKDAHRIFCIGVIFCVDGFTYMKRIKSRYDMSYLSYLYPGMLLGYDALHTLYLDLGTKNQRVARFEQNIIDRSSGRVAIDGHVIACTSENNDLSEFGYKAQKYGTPQINWMTAYDVNSKKTLASILTNGSEPDKVSVQSLFSRHTFKDTEFLVDRGFNSEKDKQLMGSNGNTYIVPMISNRSSYRNVVSCLKFDKRRYFVYKKQKYSSIVYYKEFNIDGQRYIAYKDATREASERSEYTKKMKAGKKGYTEDGLIKNDIYFGLFLLETNKNVNNASAEVVFSSYKDRWTIETYYNYVRNKSDFNALYQQDYFMCQGLGFLVSVSGMIFSDIQCVIKDAGMSMEDVMDTVGKLKMVEDGGNWQIKNKVKPVRELCEKIGFEAPLYLAEKVAT